MLNDNTYNQYKQTSINTASPEKLLLMLYEGAIKFLKRARTAMAEGNIEATNNALLKTQDIINELMVTLDMEKGGEIAQNLYNLYEYFQRQLITANTQRDITIVDEVLGYLEELQVTWTEIAGKKNNVGLGSSLNIEG